MPALPSPASGPGAQVRLDTAGLLPALDGSQLTGLTPAQVGADPAGTGAAAAAAAVVAHVGLADPHVQYQREGEKGVAGGYASLDANGRLPDVETPLVGLEQLSTGRVEFAGFTLLGGLDLRVGAGRGYFKNGPPTDVGPATTFAVTWVQTDLTLPANVVRYISVDETGTVNATAFAPSTEEAIILGTTLTTGTRIDWLSHVDVDLVQPIPDLHRFLGSALGPLWVSGLLTSISGAPSLKLAVGSGVFYIAKDRKTAPSADPITFTRWYASATPGQWNAVPAQTSVDPDNYDDGSGSLAAVPAGKWTKATLYVAPTGEGTVAYHAVYGQMVFDSQAEAELGDYPTPPGQFETDSLRCAGIVTVQGAVAITSVLQILPKIGQKDVPFTAVTEHDDLLHRDTDGHPQYQLRTEKAVANGYGSLDALAKQPLSELKTMVGATGGADGALGAVPQPLIANQTQFLRGDATWQTAPGAVVEIFDRATDPNSNDGNYRYRSIGATGNWRFTTKVPHDFGSLVSAALIGFARSASAVGAGRDIDLAVSMGNNGQLKNNRTASDTTSTYTIPAQNTLFEIPLTTVLAALTAGDCIGLFVNHNGTGGSIGYIGIRIRYNRA